MENKTAITYLDDKYNVVDEDKATKARVREYDEKGDLIKESLLVKKKKDDDFDIMAVPVELTPKQMEFIKSFNFDVDYDKLNIRTKKI